MNGRTRDGVITCYLIVFLGGEKGDRLHVRGVRLCREPPWSPTHTHGDDDTALVFMASATTYEAAEAEVLAAYPFIASRLAKRFPLG